MSGPLGNRNASKPGRERATAHLRLRCKPGDKARWEERAKKVGLKLSAWIIERLNRG